jgi:hypothetical protein
MTKDSPRTSVLRDAPKRIWIDKHGGNWSPSAGGTQDVEYILDTPEALAEAPEVQALIAEAVERVEEARK